MGENNLFTNRLPPDSSGDMFTQSSTSLYSKRCTKWCCSKGKNVNYMCAISSKITKSRRTFWFENLFSEMWWQEVRLVLTLDGGFTML